MTATAPHARRLGAAARRDPATPRPTTGTDGFVELPVATTETGGRDDHRRPRSATGFVNDPIGTSARSGHPTRPTTSRSRIHATNGGFSGTVPESIVTCQMVNRRPAHARSRPREVDQRRGRRYAAGPAVRPGGRRSPGPTRHEHRERHPPGHRGRRRPRASRHLPGDDARRRGGHDLHRDRHRPSPGSTRTSAP